MGGIENEKDNIFPITQDSTRKKVLEELHQESEYFRENSRQLCVSLASSSPSYFYFNGVDPCRKSLFE